MTHRYVTLYARYKAKYPRLRVLKRGESWFMRTIFWPLKKVTHRSYDEFTTTIGSTIYVPDDFDSWSDNAKYMMLRHEAQHVKQFHRWPLGRWAWPLNHLLMGLAYLLLLPVFWTLRAHFEREGYTQTLLVKHELKLLSRDRWAVTAERLAETFGGSTYFWMWTRAKARAWALQTMMDIEEGRIVADPDDVVA